MFHVKHFVIAILMVLAAFSLCFGANNAQQVDFLLSGSLKADGTVNSGGKVYTCDAGTVCGPSTSDPKTTWTDAPKVTPSANPVILDSLGKATVYADGNYKFQIYDSDDTLVETLDNVLYEVTGTLVSTVTTLTPSSAAVSSTDDTLLCNAATGAVTVDFSGLSAVGNTGKRLTFKKIDATTNACTLDPSGAQTIDGSATIALSGQYKVVSIESDGSNWGLIILDTVITDTIEEDTSGAGVTIDSVKHLAGSIILENGKKVFGKEVGGTQRNLVSILPDDTIRVGSTDVQAQIDSLLVPKWHDGSVTKSLISDDSSQDIRANFTIISNTGAFRFRDGTYYLGPQDGVVDWDGPLDWIAGSAGTNANSDNIPTDAWYFIGIDNSVAVSGVALTNSAFIGNTTAPTFNPTHHGWYVGNNRIIVGIFANSPSNVLSFRHDGADFFQYSDSVTDYAEATPGTGTWVDVTLTIPVFSTRAHIHVNQVYDSGAGGNAYVRTNGDSGTGIFLSRVAAGATRSQSKLPIYTDASQGIEIFHDGNSADLMRVDTFGWYFPRGM